MHLTYKRSGFNEAVVRAPISYSAVIQKVQTCMHQERNVIPLTAVRQRGQLEKHVVRLSCSSGVNDIVRAS